MSDETQTQYLDLAALPAVPTEEDHVEVDPNADPYAGPPPPNDGEHLVKVTYGSDDPEKRWQKRTDKRNGTIYYATSIISRVIAPQNEDDNKAVFDNFVSTQMYRGTSKVIGLISALRGDVTQISSHLDQVRILDELLRGEPTCGLETYWESQHNTGEKDDRGKDIWKTVMDPVTRRPYKGQKNFPRKPDGTFEHIVHSPVDGSDCPAQAKAKRYFQPGY